MTPTSGPAPAPERRPPSAAMKMAVAAAAVLVVAGGIAFYLASRTARHEARDGGEAVTTVTITGRTCEPNALTVPAGRNTFRIVNASDRAVEWEILDGVMVVEERENIAPGFTQTLTAKLAPGTFTITCGLLSNPRGTLHVTPSAESEAMKAAGGPPPVAFIGPLAEYQVYLALESAALVEGAGRFVAAVKAGDLAQAKALYAPARVSYERMGPVADRFADLDAAIDARAEYFERREQDPGFTGFHRLEWGLFAQNSTDGLAAVGDKLLADVASLRQRVRTLDLPPEALAAGAQRVVERIADQKIDGSDNRYAHSDLSDFEATLAGSRKVVDLLRPLAAPLDPTLAADLERQFGEVEAALARYHQGDGFVPYDRIGGDERAALATQLRDLAAAMARLNAALGLS